MNNKLSASTVFVLIGLGINVLFLIYNLIYKDFSNSVNKFIVIQIVYLTILAFYDHSKKKKKPL